MLSRMWARDTRRITMTATEIALIIFSSSIPIGLIGFIIIAIIGMRDR